MARYGIIIKNGMVFDGNGSKPKDADIGIGGDEIKAVGDLSEEEADEIIDARGKFVCPGFIDITNHSDTHWTLFSHPSQESLIRQGITTILGGNCGSSIAPLAGKKGLKDIERWVDASKINVNWQTVDELFSQLQGGGLAVNFATLAGLETLLDSSGGDLKQARYLLEKSLDEGALGLSTNLGLMRLESINEEELEIFFGICAGREAVTKHHLEDEGKNILPAISRIIQAARKSGARSHISHLKILGKGSWRFFEGVLKMIRNAREEGVALTFDFFPYERTGSDLFMILPPWLRRMPKKEIMEILNSTGEKRKGIIAYIKNLTLHYDKIIIASSLRETGNVGKTIFEISKSTELSPEEVVLNLLEINNLHVSIFSEVISMEHIELFAKEKYSVVASDGVGYGSSMSGSGKDLPHPRSFGAFPRAMRIFVRENGILSWEEAIYKMTGLPAKILGIKNRGKVAKGGKADIIVFNPEEISDCATYENPFQYPKGIDYVLINGEIVLNAGRLPGKFAGQVLKRE